MDAKELFKTKAEVAAELDKLGVAYPKVKSGANEGNPTISFDKLCSLYDSSVKKEPKEAEVIDPITVVTAAGLQKLNFGRR